MTIREIDPNSADEIDLVARRMRETLVEVLGKEEGAALYSMDWLVARVRWHLDPTQTTGRIYLSECAAGQITGHAIARIEHGEAGEPYGYFSTIFVEPGSRNRGIASSLISVVEGWLRALEMPRIVYNTAENNSKLVRLFARHGFRVTHRVDEMVQLAKQLQSEAI